MEQRKDYYPRLRSSNPNSIFSKIGATFLIVALGLTWLKLTWWALGSLILVGIIDLILVIAGKDTISNWIHDLFPKAIDVTIMVCLLIYTWFVFGPVGFVPVLIGVIMGHIFWND